MRVGLLFALGACSGCGILAGPDETQDTGAVAATAPDPTVAEPVTCADPHPSSCDEGAVVRGVAFSSGEGPTSGDLVVYLTHHDLGQEDQGGYYHTSVSYSDVDLSEGPKKFQLDMCEGGEMWPDDYGAYNLIVILDQNGNNDPKGFDSDRLPDEGEPSTRKFPVKPEEGGDSPCFDDLVLDCLDGASCAAY